jgi:hypothetical protein
MAVTDFTLVGPGFSTPSLFSINKLLMRDSNLPDLYHLDVSWGMGTGRVWDGIGISDDSFFMDLSDVQQTALASNAIPVVPPDLSQFEGRTWSMTFAYVEDINDPDTLAYSAEVAGQIVSLTLIPEPSAHLLTGIGLLALAMARRPFRQPGGPARSTPGPRVD